MPPTNTEPAATRESPLIKVKLPKPRIHMPRLLAWLFAAFAVFTLVLLVIPVTNNCSRIGPQTRALAQAKQIGLALKLFAGDHDGVYPRRETPSEMTTAPMDSNTAFACLFPTYVTSETIFGNKGSAYQTAVPDNVIDSAYTGTPKETLQPGENVYAYVMGLTDSDNPGMPLVADGTDGTGLYNGNPSARGGTWKGSRAVVIHLDNSGALENLTGPADARFIASPAPPLPWHAPGSNLLNFSHAREGVRLLDPATGPRRR